MNAEDFSFAAIWGILVSRFLDNFHRTRNCLIGIFKFPIRIIGRVYFIRQSVDNRFNQRTPHMRTVAKFEHVRIRLMSNSVLIEYPNWGR